jgi:TRAP transporter TAXI family solute receptor
MMQRGHCRPARERARRYRRSATFGAVALALALWSAGSAGALTYFRIGTGDASGTFFAIGSAIAGAISNPPGSRACEAGGSCGVPDLIAVAQTSQGSIENIRAIEAGQIESGLGQADLVYWASIGESVFRDSGPVQNLRAIANLYQESVHIVTRKHGGIWEIGDLAGRRIAVGPEDSDSRVTARLILAAYGLTESSYEPVYASLADATRMLEAGTIDAIFTLGPHPIPAIADLATVTPIHLIALDDPVTEKLREKYGFLAVDVIPQDLYEGVDATVTLGIGALWLVKADLDPDLVYAVTQALWHPATRMILDEAGPIGQQLRRETALASLPIPIHPGAARYYAETAALPPRPLPR